MLDGFIAPAGLVALVRNTAPWLFDSPEALAAARATGPGGRHEFLAILHHPPVAPEHPAGDPAPGTTPPASDPARLVEYFALCLAAHHASVASFVPTDVDSKIRGLLWRRAEDHDTLRAMFEVVCRFLQWDEEFVSRRCVTVGGAGIVSGHDGERLSVLMGGLGRALQLECEEVAAAAESRVEAELEREAEAFRRLTAAPGAELDLLRLAASLTHNAGDVDQGLGFWPKSAPFRARAARFTRLAHENTAPFGGAFQKAAALYKATLACEGHRNYPLRGVKALRQSADFLLPLAPFLDEWGERLGRDPRLGEADVAELLEGLVSGSRKLATQRGYYRAMAGLVAGLGSRLDGVVAKMPAATRNEFRSSEVRKLIAVPRPSFESMMRKMCRAL